MLSVPDDVGRALKPHSIDSRRVDTIILFVASRHERVVSLRKN
jgi:hypothetical protein